MPRLSHPSRLDHSNYTWRREQVMKLLIMQSCIVFIGESDVLNVIKRTCNRSDDKSNHPNQNSLFSPRVAPYIWQHIVIIRVAFLKSPTCIRTLCKISVSYGYLYLQLKTFSPHEHRTTWRDKSQMHSAPMKADIRSNLRGCNSHIVATGVIQRLDLSYILFHQKSVDV
jgi:hypothetical protein